MDSRSKLGLLLFSLSLICPHEREREREVLKKTMFKSFTVYNAIPLLTPLVDGFFYLCFLMCSHPLHCAYFLFFFPYLLQLLSFLSPLLFSTSLLSVAFLAVTPSWLYDPPPGFLIHNLQYEKAMETLDQLSSMVFPEVETTEGLYFHVSELCEPASLSLEEENSEKEDECKKMEQGMVQNIDGNVRTDSSMNVHEIEESKIKVIDSKNSPTQTNQEPGKLTDVPSLPRIQRASTISRDWESLRRDNSMRQEREWRRTLACKLYEERVTFQLCRDRAAPDCGEEMDLLWEAYETKAGKSEGQKNKVSKCQQEERKDDGKVDEEDEEEEEEDEASGQFCCLQALRLSTGKIKVGVGRSNLVKMSKILKGFTMFRVGNRSFRKE